MCVCVCVCVCVCAYVCVRALMQVFFYMCVCACMCLFGCMRERNISVRVCLLACSFVLCVESVCE